MTSAVASTVPLGTPLLVVSIRARTEDGIGQESPIRASRSAPPAAGEKICASSICVSPPIELPPVVSITRPLCWSSVPTNGTVSTVHR